MFTIFKKELKYFFSSAIGYIAIGIFILATGLLLWVIPGEYNILDNGYANVDGLFFLAPWLFLFLCPAITMRLFAEEKQNGTIDLLLSKPIHRWSIVLGKFFAGWTISIISLLPAIIWYFSVYFLGNTVGNIDSGAFWGSFIGLIFLSATYTSIGTFASSLSKNQIIAFITSATICFLMFYGFELACSMINSGTVAFYVQQFGISHHYNAISRGVIDSRDIIYFTAITALFLCITKQFISKK